MTDPVDGPARNDPALDDPAPDGPVHDDPAFDDPACADAALDELIHRADLDGLVRLIDAECAVGDWSGLLRLRNRTRAAVATGRQLWPAATLAEYRLALWAPAQWAAAVLDEDSGRFTIGPLTEVVAARHTFAELATQLPGGPRLGFIAHERALRGEVIPRELLDALAVPDVLDIPLEIQPWEPAYVLATYSDDGVGADPPPRPVAPRAPVHPGLSRGLGRSPRDETGAARASSDPVTEPPRDETSPAPASSGPVIEPLRDEFADGEPDDQIDTIRSIGRPDPPKPNRHVEIHQADSDDNPTAEPKRHVEIRQPNRDDQPNRHVEIHQADCDDNPAAESNRHVEIHESDGGVVVVDDDQVQLATRQLLETWTASSNGRVEVVCVEGDAASAVRALGVRGARLVPLDAREALAWVAWAGATGGAHGRRRGAAIGRFGAWWLVAALGDALGDWPLPPEDLGDIATELRWWWWDAGEPPLGWELQLAVEDRAEGYAWAISAHDAD